ncbi:MAG: TonB-dependent receptor [Bacteroidota bacterium]
MLQDLQDQDQISFSFDAELLRYVSIPRSIRSTSELSSYLEQNTALRLNDLGDGNYLIVPVEAFLTINLIESTNRKVEAFHIDVIDKNRNVLYQDFLDTVQPISFNWTPKPNDTLRILSSAHDPVQYTTRELLLDLQKEVKLKEKLTYLQEVVVKDYLTRGVNLDLSNQTTEMQMADLALIPGETDGDVLASLTTLPGLNTPDSRAGNLFIRGSSSDQNLILFNNIPIYHRGHYFGTISPYNPSMVSEVIVTKNGVSPEMIGRVGGSVRINSPSELKDYNTYGLGLNTLYGNAFVKKQLSEKMAIGVSARRSVPSSILSPKLREISQMVYSGTIVLNPQSGVSLSDIDVVYSDLNLNFLWKPNEKHAVLLSALNTDNSTSYDVGQGMSQNMEEHAFDNQGFSIEWSHSYSDKLKGKLVTALSDYNSNYFNQQENLMGQAIDRFSRNGLRDFQATYSLDFTAENFNTFTVGAATQNTEVSFSNRDISIMQPPVNVAETERGSIHAIFGNAKMISFGNFYFQAGGRLQYNAVTKQLYLSPRLLANYDLTRNLTMKGSTGRFFQHLSQVKYLQFGNAGFDNELWRLAGFDGLNVLQSDQSMVGTVLTRGRFLVDLELYRKKVANVNYANTFTLEPGTSYSTASWNIKGLDLFAKLELAEGIALWGSYEYTEQTINFDSLESTSYAYKYNRPHRLKLGGLWQTGSWKLSYSYKLLSGMYGRSIDLITDLDEIRIKQPPPNQGMMPPPTPGSRPVGRSATLEDLPTRYDYFSSFDIFVTKAFSAPEKRKWKAVVGLSLINIFDRENEIDQVRGGPEFQNLLPRSGLGFTPNLNITITW